MNFNEYQQLAKRTAMYPNLGDNILYPALGLCGEAGEVAENVKKMIRDDGGKLSEKRRELLKKEVGDVLWYCAMLADELGFTLGEIAELNIAKLSDRQARGVIQGAGDER
ncbi:MAG: nucleoside triphosphate pyrophosphohydrolase family protein [Blastocatellia bacterium]|nr:nucleoside triphosphate pyrophosphohydrolase family protein [Blastocatellia bacterium]